MSGKLSAVDAISPAFSRMTAQLFGPIRFRHWMRMAVVCLLTGETTGGGGGWGGANNFNFPPPSDSRPGFVSLADLPFKQFPEFLAWAAVGVMALILFVVVMIYISSVYRFILFDAVLNNRCELGKGWRRWQRQGTSYFLWQIGFGLASVAGIAVVVGGPVFAAWRAGLLRHPDQHLVVLIAGGIVLLALFVGVVILVALVSMFAKDFVVPVMALESRGAMDGWRRVLPVMGREKGAFAFYILMKILLAIGSALLFGILDFFVILMFIIPVGILGVALYFVARGAGLVWNPLTVGLVIVAGGAVLFLLLYLISIVSLPAMVFFEAYSLYFYGSRYDLLGLALSPPPPPAASVPPAMAPVPIT